MLIQTRSDCEMTGDEALSLASVPLDRYRYRAFGARTDISGMPPARQDPSFQNRTYDAGLGIYDYRNRSFDPATGRFLQRDPALGGDKLLNPYCFPGNNPVCYRDSFGLGSWVPTACPGIYKWTPDKNPNTDDEAPPRKGKNEKGEPLCDYPTKQTVGVEEQSYPFPTYLSGFYSFEDRDVFAAWIEKEEAIWNATVDAQRRAAKVAGDAKEAALAAEQFAKDFAENEREALKAIYGNWVRIQGLEWPVSRRFQRVDWETYHAAAQKARQLGARAPGNDYDYWAAFGPYGVDPKDTVGFFVVLPYVGTTHTSNRANTYPLTGPSAVNRLLINADMHLERDDPKSAGRALLESTPVIPFTKWTVEPKKFIRTRVGMKIFSRKTGQPGCDAWYFILRGNTEVFSGRIWDVDNERIEGNAISVGTSIGGERMFEGQDFQKVFGRPGKYKIELRIGGHTFPELTQTITFK